MNKMQNKQLLLFKDLKKKVTHQFQEGLDTEYFVIHYCKTSLDKNILHHHILGIITCSIRSQTFLSLSMSRLKHFVGLSAHIYIFGIKKTGE